MVLKLLLMILCALFFSHTGLSGEMATLAPIAERGVMVQDQEGRDLIGVSGLTCAGDYLFMICESQLRTLYWGELMKLCGRAMGSLENNALQVNSAPIIYLGGIEEPMWGRGAGYEAVEVRSAGGELEIFLSYESDSGYYIYRGHVQFTNGKPESVNINERHTLPSNPEGYVHNAGWEAIAWDSESEEIMGIFENRLAYMKMAFLLDARMLPADITSNLPSVPIEYRVTDLACFSSGSYLASIYIWLEDYQNAAGETIQSSVPQFRIVKLTKEKLHNNQLSLKPVILKTFKEEEFMYGDDHLNFEGIAVVKDESIHRGILLINDNDPPYIKILNKGDPPTILRYLTSGEFNNPGN